jgi:hypothetical protein
MRTIIAFTVALATVGVAAHAEGQGRSNRGSSRNEIARAQGVPPGQMPPSNLCRVWYSDRSPGRQPAATDCRTAELTVSRNRNARVIYGENAYDDRYYGGYRNDPYYGRNDSYGYPDNGRAVPRDGRVRDPRYGTNDPYYSGRSVYGSEAYQQGYRDGLEKGREDGNRNNRYDVNRHSWYRSATRGYDDDYGTRAEYQVRYRDGFESGYSEGFRVYSRR